PSGWLSRQQAEGEVQGPRSDMRRHVRRRRSHENEHLHLAQAVGLGARATLIAGSIRVALADTGSRSWCRAIVSSAANRISAFRTGRRCVGDAAMKILGIDPGIHGALALVDIIDGTTPQLVGIVDVPVIGTGAKERVNTMLVRDWLAQHQPDHALIERAGS